MTDPQNHDGVKTRATPARQGRLGRPMLIVLVVSVTLAFAGLLASWLLRADDLASTEPHNARQANDAQLFEQPEPTPIIPNPDETGTAAPVNQGPPPVN
ncbi:MAG TPA: hypothetical protein PKA17_11030 [Phenylobacterium sp.]|nr:hypothetical protein [Phenylobacterium sp.]